MKFMIFKVLNVVVPKVAGSATNSGHLEHLREIYEMRHLDTLNDLGHAARIGPLIHLEKLPA